VAAEQEILECIPPPIDPAVESQVIAADPELAERLATLRCEGQCREKNPCYSCLIRRRFLALRLHRERHGIAPHASDAAYENIPLPNPSDAAKTAAKAMAHDPRLIERIAEDCGALGIVGERELAQTIYVVGTSRLLDKPLSAIVQGLTGAGKSFIVATVSRCFPVDAVLHATRMTPQAIYHTGSLAHKFVVAGERSRRQDDDSADATAALRQLQSEGRITKLVTESEEGKFKSRLVEQQGPIAYVETTTLKPDRIFPEDLNRALLLKVNESEEQTRAILTHAAARYESVPTPNTEPIIARHREFQSMLKSVPVTIPFAHTIVDCIPARKPDARRVTNQVLSMIEAVALLHQYQRDRDDEGRLIATADDYAVARRLLFQPLSESLGVPESAKQLFCALAKHFRGRNFTTSETLKLDRLASDSSVKNWLWQLSDHGCIRQVEPAKGPRPACWRLTGKTPEQAILPEVELVASRQAAKAVKMANCRLPLGKNQGLPLAGKPPTGKTPLGSAPSLVGGNGRG
jgi:hypothetical protein